MHLATGCFCRSGSMADMRVMQLCPTRVQQASNWCSLLISSVWGSLLLLIEHGRRQLFADAAGVRQHSILGLHIQVVLLIPS